MRTVLAVLAAGLAGLAAHGIVGAAEPPSAEPAPARGVAKRIGVVFVENDLRAPGLAVPEERDERLVDYRFFELGRFLKERVPPVFAANGLEGEVALVPSQQGGAPIEIPAASSGEPTLLLRVRSVRLTRTGIQRRAYVDLEATLLGRPTPGAPREVLWSSLHGLRLGNDEAMGLMLTHRIDAERVDSIVMALLNGMAAKGLVALPQDKAVRPKGP